MNVLITGESGFLAKYLKEQFNGHCLTIGRNQADIKCDLTISVPKCLDVKLVVHAAGKAHSIPKTALEAQQFFDVNVIGTQNLLKGLEKAPHLPDYFVFISSVSVYGVDTGHLIKESAPLLAKDPYGKSKIEAEEIVKDWCTKNDVVCTILRLPLLAGANPPGNLGAMIKGIQKGYYFDIAGGRAKKSIVLAIDVAKIIPTVAKIGGTYNLTDRCHPSFRELSGYIATQLNKARPLNMPAFAARLMAKIGDFLGTKAPINSQKLSKITSDLTFDDSEAVRVFGWNPTPISEGFKIS